MNQIKIECVLLLQDVVALVRADDIDQALKVFWFFTFLKDLYYRFSKIAFDLKMLWDKKNLPMIKSSGVKLFSFHHAHCWPHRLGDHPNLSNDSYLVRIIHFLAASVESIPFTSSSANFNKFFWLDAIWKYHMVSTVKCKDNRDLKSRFI